MSSRTREVVGWPRRDLGQTGPACLASVSPQQAELLYIMPWLLVMSRVGGGICGRSSPAGVISGS